MQVTSIVKVWSVQMHRSLHSVSTYFLTQAPVYQAQATQPLTQHYNNSTFLQVDLTSSTDTNIQNIPAAVVTARNKRYRKVTYKHKTARRVINLSYTILA